MKKTGTKDVFVNIPLNLVCNYNCNFCAFSDIINKNKNLYFDNIDDANIEVYLSEIFFESTIINDVKYHITFVGGEPTLSYDKFYFLFSKIIEYGYIDLIDEILFYTNGAELSEFIEKGMNDFGSIFQKKINFIINIQGIDKTYKVLSGVNNSNYFKKVIDSIEKLNCFKLNFSVYILLNKINFSLKHMYNFVIFLNEINVRNIKFGFLILLGKAKENQKILELDYFSSTFIKKIKHFSKFLDKFNDKGCNYNLLDKLPQCVQEKIGFSFINENNIYGIHNKKTKIFKMYSDNFGVSEFDKFIYSDNIEKANLYKNKKYINDECIKCLYNKKCLFISGEVFSPNLIG